MIPEKVLYCIVHSFMVCFVSMIPTVRSMSMGQHGHTDGRGSFHHAGVGISLLPFRIVLIVVL